MMKAGSLGTEGFSLNSGTVTCQFSVLGRLLNISAPHLLHVEDENNNVPISLDYSERKMDNKCKISLEKSL